MVLLLSKIVGGVKKISVKLSEISDVERNICSFLTDNVRRSGKIQ